VIAKLDDQRIALPVGLHDCAPRRIPIPTKMAPIKTLLAT
jgi:hypothetical protein